MTDERRGIAPFRDKDIFHCPKCLKSTSFKACFVHRNQALIAAWVCNGNQRTNPPEEGCNTMLLDSKITRHYAECLREKIIRRCIKVGEKWVCLFCGGEVVDVEEIPSFL